MKKTIILIALLSLYSCNDEDYEIIDDSDLKELTIQDTLVNNSNHLMMSVGKSISDEYPKLLVKKKHLYLFERDYEIKNDTTILSYYSAFLIDSHGAFRKNGIWIHAKFYNEGIFPFNKKIIEYSVDSIPTNWDEKSPNGEGIYFYENNSLKLHSNEQSEQKFIEQEKTGFYFIPNKGRLFNKTNVSELD